jgi:hypothetical protein
LFYVKLESLVLIYVSSTEFKKEMEIIKMMTDVFKE